jgi:uncharacterized protein YbgA (DUF1722 family)
MALAPLSRERRAADRAAATDARARVAALLADAADVGALVRLHTREKLLLLAHEPAGYTALGRLVASAAARPLAEVARAYQRRFDEATARAPTRGTHVNALQHMAGYFRSRGTAAERAAIAGAIDAFAAGQAQLSRPRGAIRNAARRLALDYLLDQTYLADDG